MATQPRVRATNYLYRLYDAKTGAYLKTGISKNTGSRYTKTFMLDKEMQMLQTVLDERCSTWSASLSSEIRGR
jgi:hypothetical protein